MADSIQISSAKLASEMGDRSQTLVQLGGTEPRGTGRYLYLHTFDIFFVIWGKCVNDYRQEPIRLESGLHVICIQICRLRHVGSM